MSSNITSAAVEVRGVALGAMPAHLWVGPTKEAKKQLVATIQGQVCSSHGCHQCMPCRAIENRQYHALLWLYPEARYTLEQFDELFQRVVIRLEDGEQFFIVIQSADALSSACANTLLKVLEEPPAGYYFLLTAERLDEVLPTIRSRCMMHTVAGTPAIAHQELFDFLVTTKGFNPVAFSQHLYQSTINEREVGDLVDALLAYWLTQYKKSVQHDAADRMEHARQMITFLKKTMTQLPMPGSSKLFLRDLYLQIKEFVH